MFGFLAMETHCYFWCCTSWKRLGIKVDKDAGAKSFCILNSWMSWWFSVLSFNFDNPVSLYNSLKGINFVPPDMILIHRHLFHSKNICPLLFLTSRWTSTLFPSPLRLFVILSLTQLYRYTPEIFLFSTATFKYTYRPPPQTNWTKLVSERGLVKI